VLLALAIEANRGVTWFILFVLVVLPGVLGELHLPSVSIRKSGVGVVVASFVALGALIVAASRPESWFAREYPTSAARVVADAAGPNRAVFANGAFGDWLLLKEPSLRGRMAYDARFEVLPHGRLADAAAVSIGRYDSEQILQPFDVVVLRPGETELRETLGRAGGWRQIDAGSKVVVLRRATG